MSNSQKNKGKNFERKVATILTQTFKATFTRVPNSGAFVGKSNAHRLHSLDSTQAKLHRGDILCPADFNMVIECKCYNKLTGGFHSIIANDSNQLDKWLNQVSTDANQSLPYALIFQISHTGCVFVCLSNHFKEVQQYLPAFTQYCYNNEIHTIFEINFLNQVKEIIKKVTLC